ncbi:response regulator [Siculibacillus lacustris]|uniref:Response regulator n=1 Tax=Siculibacillus lacustris TaxID=1549641 RepID=A0A4Q9VKA3_9HYPH|nr:response regulator [Siculibacillus lacustris]TBW35819.1 response regulator [Siculibacillus lacustris]
MLKVLIVEDELMIADMVEEMLVDGGYEVCGIARTVEDAAALGRLHQPDLAVIDVRLAGGGLGIDIPERWADLDRIGILYATGNPIFLMQSGAVGDACLTKPYNGADLQRSLAIVTALVAGGTATAPFPRGFQLLHGEARANAAHGG